MIMVFFAIISTRVNAKDAAIIKIRFKRQTDMQTSIIDCTREKGKKVFLERFFCIDRI